MSCFFCVLVLPPGFSTSSPLILHLRPLLLPPPLCHISLSIATQSFFLLSFFRPKRVICFHVAALIISTVSVTFHSEQTLNLLLFFLYLVCFKSLLKVVRLLLMNLLFFNADSACSETSKSKVMSSSSCFLFLCQSCFIIRSPIFNYAFHAFFCCCVPSGLVGVREGSV